MQYMVIMLLVLISMSYIEAQYDESEEPQGSPLRVPTQDDSLEISNEPPVFAKHQSYRTIQKQPLTCNEFKMQRKGNKKEDNDSLEFLPTSSAKDLVFVLDNHRPRYMTIKIDQPDFFLSSQTFNRNTDEIIYNDNENDRRAQKTPPKQHQFSYRKSKPTKEYDEPGLRSKLNPTDSKKHNSQSLDHEKQEQPGRTNKLIDKFEYLKRTNKPNGIRTPFRYSVKQEITPKTNTDDDFDVLGIESDGHGVALTHSEKVTRNRSSNRPTPRITLSKGRRNKFDEHNDYNENNNESIETVNKRQQNASKQQTADFNGWRINNGTAFSESNRNMQNNRWISNARTQQQNDQNGSTQKGRGGSTFSSPGKTGAADYFDITIKNNMQMTKGQTRLDGTGFSPSQYLNYDDDEDSVDNDSTDIYHNQHDEVDMEDNETTFFQRLKNKLTDMGDYFLGANTNTSKQSKLPNETGNDKKNNSNVLGAQQGRVHQPHWNDTRGIERQNGDMRTLQSLRSNVHTKFTFEDPINTVIRQQRNVQNDNTELAQNVTATDVNIVTEVISTHQEGYAVPGQTQHNE